MAASAQHETDSAACSKANGALTHAFDLLGRRWTGPVIGVLRDGPIGFRDIARSIEGISDSMLSARLADLTEAGIVTREVAEGPPVSVAYALTESGHALIPALMEISSWATQYLPAAE